MYILANNCLLVEVNPVAPQRFPAFFKAALERKNDSFACSLCI